MAEREIKTGILDYISVKNLDEAIKVVDKKLAEDEKADKHMSTTTKKHLLDMKTKYSDKSMQIAKEFNKLKKTSPGLVQGKALLNMRMVDIYQLKGKKISENVKDDLKFAGKGGLLNKDAVLGIGITLVALGAIDGALNQMGSNIPTGVAKLVEKMWTTLGPAATIGISTGTLLIAGVVAKQLWDKNRLKLKQNQAIEKDAKTAALLGASGIERDRDGNLVAQKQNHEANKQEAIDNMYEVVMNLKKEEVTNYFKQIRTGASSPIEKEIVAAAEARYNDAMEEIREKTKENKENSPLVASAEQDIKDAEAKEKTAQEAYNKVFGDGVGKAFLEAQEVYKAAEAAYNADPKGKMGNTTNKAAKKDATENLDKAKASLKKATPNYQELIDNLEQAKAATAKAKAAKAAAEATYGM